MPRAACAGRPDPEACCVLQMDASSIPIAVGEPIGGGLFVSNVVLAFVVFVGGRGSPVEIEKGAFLRDVGFYCGATLLVSLIAADGMVRIRPCRLSRANRRSQLLLPDRGPDC